MEGASGQTRAPAPFLRKTWDLVEDAQSDGIVSWTAEGASFVVSRPAELASDILPKYFKHNNFSSFVRQLNTYGFRKVDPDRWEFSNECFQRGRRDLLGSIVRRKPASATAGRGSGVNEDGMPELDPAHSDALHSGGAGMQQPGQQQQQQQQQWNGGPPSGPPSGFTSPRGDAGNGYPLDRTMYRSGSGTNDLPAQRLPSTDQQQGQLGDHRSAFRRPPGYAMHIRGGSSEDPSPPLPGGLDPHSSGGSGATNMNGGALHTPFAFGSGAPPPPFSGPIGGQAQAKSDDKSHLQRLADHAHTLQQRGPPEGLTRRSDNDISWHGNARAQRSADSGSTQPSGGDTPGATGGSAPHTGGSCGSAGGGHMDTEDQGGAKKRKFRGARQGMLIPDLMGDKDGSADHGGGSGGLSGNRSGGNSDVSRPTPVNFADMASQLSRMSQLAIDVENLKMRNALLESELLRTRQTDWQDRATMEARMASAEEYRAQAEARNRLEDTWKAGQEAAMFRWRAEQHAMQQGEVAWKSMNDARFGDLMRQYAARNNAEDAWKAQSEARMKAGEDFQAKPPARELSLFGRQIASETREAIREQERRSGSSKERSGSQDLSGDIGRPLQGMSRGNSAGPAASNDTQGSGGPSGGAGAMAAPGAPGGAAIHSGGAGSNGPGGFGGGGAGGGSGGLGATGNTGGTGASNDRSGASSDEAQRAAQLQKLMEMRGMTHDSPSNIRSNGSHDLSSATDERARAEIDRMQHQSDAMEARIRASEAAAAVQVQQAREIAARFNEQSAKNQYDSQRDHHFEQRLMLQERHVQQQADANTKLQEQVLELTRQLALEREARVASDDARRSASLSDGHHPSNSHGVPARSGSAQSGSVLSGTDPHGPRPPNSEAQSARGGPGLPPTAPPPRAASFPPQQSPRQPQAPGRQPSPLPPPRAAPPPPRGQQHGPTLQQLQQQDQAMPAESEPQASRMSMDEQGAEALRRDDEVDQLRMPSVTFSNAPPRLHGSAGNSNSK